MKNLGLAVVEVVPDGDVPDSMYDNLVDNVGMWRGVFMLPPAEMRELGLTGQIMAAMAYEIDDNEEDVNCAADMLGETWTYVYNTRTLYVRLKGAQHDRSGSLGKYVGRGEGWCQTICVWHVLVRN